MNDYINLVMALTLATLLSGLFVFIVSLFMLGDREKENIIYYIFPIPFAYYYCLHHKLNFFGKIFVILFGGIWFLPISIFCSITIALGFAIYKLFNMLFMGRKKDE